jgi:hypothetical protein
MTTTDIELRYKKTGRNDDCPCGSGKKYKKCHLLEDEAAVSKLLADRNAAAAAAKTAEAEGHVHGPDCDHEAEATAAPARPQVQHGPVSAAPKQPMSHKPMNTPRKAV